MNALGFMTQPKVITKENKTFQDTEGWQLQILRRCGGGGGEENGVQAHSTTPGTAQNLPSFLTSARHV